MRPRLAVPALFVCLLTPLHVFAQATTAVSNTTSASVQALAALQNAYAALNGSATVSDITLTGTAEWIAGSDDETGTVTYKAIPGANRLDMNLSGGTRTEIRNPGADGPAGAWVGVDGVSHSISYHNLLTDTGWFPLFAIGNINSSASTVLTYVGLETRDGIQVIHLTASQQPPSAAGQSASLLQHLSQVDIYLSSATFLPASVVFNIHPDDNALLDIPTEVRYSNYQQFAGAQIPMHIQKFINNNLSLDLQFQSAVLNSGVSVSSISTQ
jgi:hypothetical protein